MNKNIFKMTPREFDEFMNSENGQKFIEDLVETMERLEKENAEKIKIIKTREYMEWLVDFIQRCPDDGYDSEYFLYHSNLFTDEDKKNEELLDFFFDFLKDMDAITDCSDDYDFFEEYISYFYFNKHLYQYRLVIGQGSIISIKNVTEANKDNLLLGLGLREGILNLDKYFGEEDD